MKHYLKQAIFGSSVFISLSNYAFAKITMPTFFSDKMVIQQETGAKIWGSANAEQEITVSFRGQVEKTKSDKSGKWSIELKGLKASSKGEVMNIEAGKDKHQIKDVLVGEVWIASGQSNMEWVMDATNGKADAAIDKDDLLRVYVSGNATSMEGATDFAGTWLGTKPENTGKFTAVGYEFAKVLRKELDVPVGVIECAWGGQAVQAFVREEALKSCPEAAEMIALKEKSIAAYSLEKAKEKYNKATANWKEAMAKWEANDPKKGRKPRKPRLQRHPALSPNMASTIYNGMIAPIAGYGARGVIWYQGEANARSTEAANYGELLECLIQDWRKQWDIDLSFYYVQLASFTKEGKNKPYWVIVQDEMRRLLDDSNSKTGNIGMAVINDIGHPTDIHPGNKKDVGKRLARWALNQDYQMKDIIVSGPLYKSHIIKGSSIEISFDHASGMKSRDGKPLGSFEIAGADNQWKPAVATINSDKIILMNAEINKPTQARYAWASYPTDANLVNGEGLPASCFITQFVKD